MTRAVQTTLTYSPQARVETLVISFRRALARVFPGCVTIGQAVAFNMFLAFFPMLLLAVAMINAFDMFRGAAVEIPARLQPFFPPGSDQLVLDYLHRGLHPGRLAALGLGGTLIAGSQVMVGLMQGFRIAYREKRQATYLGTQLRALLLLCVVMGPWNIVVVLTVFGRRARAQAVQMLGLRGLASGAGVVVSLAIVLGLALIVLMVLYRVGRDSHHGWRDVLPGAFVATILWWVIDMGFGLYVRHVPYKLVYGGVATAIGLMLWMYMTAMVIFIGAAFNAEGVCRAEEAGKRPVIAA